MEVIAAVLSILAAILPPLVAHFAALSKKKGEEHASLTERSIDELSIGAERMPK